MAKTLHHLPEEILVQIISLVPQLSLLALAQCSRQLHRLARAELYSTVYYEAAALVPSEVQSFAIRALAFEGHDESAAGGNLRTRRCSQIFRLEQFLMTITLNPNIRSLINAAALEYIPSTQFKVNPDAIQSNSSLRDKGEKGVHQVDLPDIGSLHLAFDHYEIENNFMFLPLRSLSLHHSNEVYDIDYLYSLFNIPTLRWLSISGLTWSHPLLRKDDIDRSRTSTLTKLSFPSSAPSANDLAELLTWPIALRHFSLEASPDERPAQPRVRRLIQLLSLQRETLEELYLSGEPRHPLLSYRLGLELIEFSALKRLSIHGEWLQPPIIPSIADPGSTAIWDVLPLNLEHLQIEIPVILHYCDMRWDGSLDENYLGARRQAIVPLLHALTQKKVSRQMSLEEVIIWYRKRDGLDSGLPGMHNGHRDDYQARMYSRLFPQEGTTERVALETAFDEVGCKLLTCCSVEPPLIQI